MVRQETKTCSQSAWRLTRLSPYLRASDTAVHLNILSGAMWESPVEEFEGLNLSELDTDQAFVRVKWEGRKLQRCGAEK